MARHRSRAREILKLLILDLAKRTVIEAISRPRRQEAERRVQKFKQTLAARHGESWTIETMSSECGLRRTHFAQLLKKLTGDTPVTFLNRLRVREAQKLLRNSNKSITEIGLEVGFNSSQYFATVFKEFTEDSPRAFRAR